MTKRRVSPNETPYTNKTPSLKFRYKSLMKQIVSVTMNGVSFYFPKGLVSESITVRQLLLNYIYIPNVSYSNMC